MPRVKLVHVPDHLLDRYDPDTEYDMSEEELNEYLREVLKDDIIILPEKKSK